MIYPISNSVVTQYFGEHPEDYLQYGYPGHNGIDLVTDDSPPLVYAFRAGRCVKVGWQEDGYGKYIVLDHGDCKSYYCHLDEVYIKPGDRVEENQPIGLMGSTGNSSGPHLHFAIESSKMFGSFVPGYKDFLNPSPFLAQAIQPEIVNTLPVQPSTQTITKPKIIPQKKQPGKPIVRGRRTWYPRVKYF